jgi:putative phosphoribosyl transferase
MFRDRIDAGQQLAHELCRYKLQRPLILALPRGGVVVGAAMAGPLDGELDVLLIKKLRAPGNPELAIGAISEEGHRYLNEDIQFVTHATDAYLEKETRQRLAEMAGQRSLYRAGKPKIPIAGREVVLVDDGLATGATMMAAVQVTSAAVPARLILAVPVGPPETVQRFAELETVEAVVCLLEPDWFGGVGQFYRDFTQVEDAEVMQWLTGS